MEEEPEVAEVAEAEVEEVVEVTNVEAATVAPGDAEPVAVCVADAAFVAVKPASIPRAQ